MTNPQIPGAVVVLEDEDNIDWKKNKDLDVNKLIDEMPGNPRIVLSSPGYSHQAQTVRVVYNPHNLDSCLALTIIAERVKQAHSGSKIIPVSIDYASHDSVVGEADILVICGVSVDDHAFLHEVDLAKPQLILRFSYLDQTVNEADPPTTKGYLKINPVNIIDGGLTETVPGQMADLNLVGVNSISMLVNEYFHRHLHMGTPCTEDQQRLMEIVGRYINFGKFDGIWEKDPADEKAKLRFRENNDLAFLYRNVRGIRRAAESGDAHLIVMGGSEDPRDFKDEIGRIRKIIHRNMQDKVYAASKKYLAANTVCVGEDDSFEVMRQLKHSFTVSITYEDIRNQRIWRIACNEQPTVDLLKEALKPNRTWLDCRIHYFSCDLPQVNEKVQ